MTDFDGDGYRDLILTAPQEPANTTTSTTSHGNGKIYILYGSVADFAAKIDLNELEPKRDEPLINHVLRDPGSSDILVVPLK